VTESEVRHLVRAVVEEGRSAVRALQDQRSIISRYWQFPKLGTFDGGLPNVSHMSDGPTDYASLFKLSGAGDYDIAYEVLTTLPALRICIEADERLRSRIILPGRGGDSAMRERIDAISVALLPLDLLDRLLHVHGEDFGEQDFDREWEPIQAWLLADGPLPVEIVVPIAMVSCELEVACDVGPGLRIEPISELEHLARVLIGSSCRRPILASSAQQPTL
jgi:hypothetical protein